MRLFNVALVLFLAVFCANAQEFPAGTSVASTNVVGSDYPRVDDEGHVYFMAAFKLNV